VRSCTERGRAGGDKRSAFPAYQRARVQAISELAELRFHVDVDRFVPRRIQSVVPVRQNAGIASMAAHLRLIGVITG
jgi:hypothetical protein